MECALLRRKYGLSKTTATVTLTGSGKSETCYVEYGGRKYYTFGNTFTVSSGDTISFTATQYVDIDGVRVMERTDLSTTGTYIWTVPRGIGTVNVRMQYESRRTRITVTTA